MTATLAYVILGGADDAGDSERRLLSFSGSLPSVDPAFYTDLIQLRPMLADDAPQPSLALLPFDESRLLLVACQPADTAATEHYVLVPQSAAPMANQWHDWLPRLPQPPADHDMTVVAMPAPAAMPPDLASSAVCLETLLDLLPAGKESALRLLGELIGDWPARIANFPPDLSKRLDLIAGLQALLPATLAARLSYATNAPVSSQNPPKLTFADASAYGENRLDWDRLDRLDAAPDHAYIDLLRGLWQGDSAALALEIASMDSLIMDTESPLQEALAALADRRRLDKRVQEGADTDTKALLKAVDAAAPPIGDSRRAYFGQLLRNALQNRDREAGKRVAVEMQNDPRLEGRLLRDLDAMLDDEPDAVYIFIRRRLLQLGIDAAWITRLNTAARSSLDVAIQEGDSGTLIRWLQHIAHEPATHQLLDCLRDSVRAARPRACDDGELGLQLILIAARKLPQLADELCKDNQLLAALPDAARLALTSPSAANLEPLADLDAETFLLALRRGMDAGDEPLVNLASARKLAQLHDAGERVDLSADYQPAALIQQLTTQASRLLADDALDLLFARIVRGDDLELTTAAASHLAERGQLFPRLTLALEREIPPLDKLHAILKAVSAFDDMPPQDLVECYFSLLDQVGWDSPSQRLVESLARFLAQRPNAHASPLQLWRLYESCRALQMEGACRVAIARLLREFGADNDASDVVAHLARVYEQVAWSEALRDFVDDWWRGYAHSLALPQLQRLERELEGQRQLDSQRHILKTSIAMRRWLHSRDPIAFADAINTAFTIVEQLTEAFDSAAEIDSRTIRSEVDALSDSLSSEQRHILAANLRNLAQRITQMADKRSKPSLIRSDDSIDRQLMQGEAHPHGAIDMMKWVAGYLDGAHSPDD